MLEKLTVKKVVMLIILILLFLHLMSGCSNYHIPRIDRELIDVQGKVASVVTATARETYGPDELVNLLKALQSGNTASIPFNPYALPVGIGLTGIITMLEALRRKEKGGRKYAEHELKNGNGNNGKRSKGKT